MVMLCLLCVVQLMVRAQQGTEQMRVEIGRAAQSVKTLQCDFIQTKHLKMLNDKMVSKGKMYYRQGRQLRWEYIAPYTYTFILNNDRVLLKKGDREDVVDINQNKMFKEIARMMMSSVTGDCLNDQGGFRCSLSAVNGEWVATLLPLRKEMKQLFRSVVLHFSRSLAVVTAVELIEKNGDRTVIELKNIRKNEAIGSDRFAVH